jgi:RNA polymerase-interacting CarD/CdnL/TRCF family regulator
MTVSRQREEATKSSALKTQAQLALARGEVERLNSLLLDARHVRDQPSVAADTKQAQDAALRRLDNEKQYLKNQLASEITLKVGRASICRQCCN